MTACGWTPPPAAEGGGVPRPSERLCTHGNIVEHCDEAAKDGDRGEDRGSGSQFTGTGRVGVGVAELIGVCMYMEACKPGKRGEGKRPIPCFLNLVKDPTTLAQTTKEPSTGVCNKEPRAGCGGWADAMGSGVVGWGCEDLWFGCSTGAVQQFWIQLFPRNLNDLSQDAKPSKSIPLDAVGRRGRGHHAPPPPSNG